MRRRLALAAITAGLAATMLPSAAQADPRCADGFEVVCHVICNVPKPRCYNW